MGLQYYNAIAIYSAYTVPHMALDCRQSLGIGLDKAFGNIYRQQLRSHPICSSDLVYLCMMIQMGNYQFAFKIYYITAIHQQITLFNIKWLKVINTQKKLWADDQDISARVEKTGSLCKNRFPVPFPTSSLICDTGWSMTSIRHLVWTIKAKLS